MRKETQQGLQAFRKQQEEADKKARGGETTVDEAEGEAGEWVAGVKKRKRGKEKEVLKGVKIRRASTLEEPAKKVGPVIAEGPKSKPTGGKEVGSITPAGEKPKETNASKPENSATIPKTSPPSKSGLGLVDYGSDDDDW